MMPLLVAKVLDKTISVASLISRTSERPAMVLGIRKSGFATGDRADFALYEKSPARIRAGDLHSRSGWSPFDGMRAVFPRMVVMGGEVVFSDGEFFEGTPQWFPGRGYRKAE
jgi:dihydroorotase